MKGIRQLHSVRTCSEQLKIFTRERACYCHDCLAGCYNRCENTEWVDDWKEVKLARKPSGSTTIVAEDVTTTEKWAQLADLATKDSIVAVGAEDDSHYDYYLLKITSDGMTKLKDNFKDPYGNI